MPTLGEYYGRKLYYDSLYWLPYLVAGLLATIIGYVVVPLLLVRISATRRFSAASSLTLALLVVLAVLSDLGARITLWRAPMFVLHGNFTVLILVMSKVFLPASIISGLIHATGRGIPTNTEHRPAPVSLR